jgi:TOBE domain
MELASRFVTTTLIASSARSRAYLRAMGGSASRNVWLWILVASEEPDGARLCGVIDSVSIVGDRQRLVVSGASTNLINVDAPNTIQVKTGDRIGLLIAPEAVRLLPPEH